MDFRDHNVQRIKHHGLCKGIILRKVIFLRALSVESEPVMVKDIFVSTGSVMDDH